MKKILIAFSALTLGAAAASAADLPVRTYTKAPPPVVAPVWSWTGCYIGAEGGGAWGRQTVTDSPTVGFDPDTGLPVTLIKPSGGLFGGTIGCNYQVSNFVVGIEDDLSWSGLKGSANDFPPFTTTFFHTVSTTWLDTLRGRVGVTWDRALFYVTGGAAFTNIRDAVFGDGATTSTTTNRAGWTAGVGVEYMFAPGWSAKLEYLYADFGTVHDPFDLVPTPPSFSFSGVNSHLTENIVRAGINWHFNFGGAPVAARY